MTQFMAQNLKTHKLLVRKNNEKINILEYIWVRKGFVFEMITLNNEGVGFWYSGSSSFNLKEEGESRRLLTVASVLIGRNPLFEIADDSFVSYIGIHSKYKQYNQQCWFSMISMLKISAQDLFVCL